METTIKKNTPERNALIVRIISGIHKKGNPDPYTGLKNIDVYPMVQYAGAGRTEGVQQLKITSSARIVVVTTAGYVPITRFDNETLRKILKAIA